MQPFSVFCETCGAKLKVRDPAAVGQIHACPKCGSMVLIAAPSGAATAEAVRSAPAAPQSAEPMAPANFAGEIDELLQAPADAGEPLDEHELRPAEPSDPADAPGGQHVADPSAAPLAAPASRIGPAVWGTAGVVAFFAVGVLGAAWWSKQGESPPAVAVADARANDTARPAAATDPVPEVPAESAPLSETITAEKPAVAATAEQPPTADAEAENEPDAGVAVALPDLPPLPSSEEGDKPAGEEEAAEEPSASITQRTDTLPPLDPLAIDSANLDLLLVPDQEASEIAAAEPPSMDDAEVQETDEMDVAPPAQQVRYDPGSASRGPSFAESFGAGELTSRLATRLPAVEWHQVPLHRALDELGQLSGVPITIDPAALRMSGRTATHTITVATQDATVLELATEAAKAVQLSVEQHASGLVLAKPGAEKVRDVNYRVDDLLPAGAKDAEPIAALIRKFVAPGSWGSRIGACRVEGGTVRVKHRAAVHYEILIFCERLRKARGLATRSRYPSEHLQIEPRLAGLSDKLDQTTTLAFVDWTPLADVFGYWQASSGMAMLVDWQRLADQDQRPLATMAGSVTNKPWSAALDACLAPLELDWVPIDLETIQITTLSAASNAAWVDFYAAPDAEAMRDRIEQSCDEVALATLELEADSTGDFVIVRGNRRIHSVAASDP